MEKLYCVYILTNDRHTVLYTGVTSNLPGRMFQHHAKLLRGFTKRYNISKLVYFECGSEALGAIAREKQIKAGSRQKKIDLITAFNPGWRDLYGDFNPKSETVIASAAKQSRAAESLSVEIASSLRSSQ